MAATAVQDFETLFAPAVSIVHQKCPHGLYVREYCSVCTPGGPKNTRKVVISKYSNHPLTAPAKRANLNVPGECPNCHSRIHEEINAKTWQCSDCGEKFAAPKVRVR